MRRPAHATLATGLLLLAGCALPEGDTTSPEGAHYLVVHARAAGDVKALWELHHPDVRGAFERWHASESKAVQHVRVLYPKEGRDAALRAMGGGRRAELGSAEALFAATLGIEAPTELSGLVAIGARVKSVALEGEDATIRTWAGDEARFRKGPGEEGRWYAVLGRDDAARLEAAAAKAEANLRQVEENLALMRGEAK